MVVEAITADKSSRIFEKGSCKRHEAVNRPKAEEIGQVFTSFPMNKFQVSCNESMAEKSGRKTILFRTHVKPRVMSYLMQNHLNALCSEGFLIFLIFKSFL